MTSDSKIVDLNRHIPDDDTVTAEATTGDTVDAHQNFQSTDDLVVDDSGLDNMSYDDLAYEDEYVSGRRWTALIAPMLLGSVFIAWTGFFGLTFYNEAAGGISDERIVALIGRWAVPTLLLAVLWLLFTRNSQAEANRFGDTTRLLRTESEALERRMRTVNEEIAMAREFLAQNARELETIGRQSSRKLVEAAEQLAAALADSDQKAKTLELVSNAATSNLEQLRKHLPVVTSAAKDVTNQIGSAGNNAQVQVKSLIEALQHVGDAGQIAREQIDNIEERAGRVSEALNGTIENSAAVLTESTTAAEVRAKEMSALMASAGTKLAESVAAASGDVYQLVEESAVKLTSQLGNLRNHLADVAGQSADEEARIASILGRISSHIESSAARISEIDTAATDQTAKLAFAVSALGESTRDVGTALGSNQGKTDRLLAQSEKLLLSLASANQEIDHSLPQAMDRMDDRFSLSLAQLASAADSANSLDNHSDNMLAKLTSLEHLIGVQRTSVDTLMRESDEHFASRHEQAEALGIVLAETRKLVVDITETADDKLLTSLQRVRDTTQQAAESSRKILDEELTTVAERLSEQNRALLANAVDDQIKALNESMQSSIERNLTVTETATAKMTAQLAQIDEMTGNLERRLSDAHESFNDTGDDSFARRMVLLTESLNSTSIDVAKILSNDVTDTAWAAYLKGDRGVFTRRAVRLLDAGEARAIATHYGDDSEFREHVNRYIHDFEAMMRVLLSSRDGNAIGVTLLSSDVGKLYVALAQAIERLRS